jgi:thioredoxin 1
MTIDSVTLKEKINSGEKLIVDFYATWCGPCKTMKPLFESASKSDTTDTNYYLFDIDTDISYAKSLGIRGVPTIKAFNQGEEKYSKSGIHTTEGLLEISQKILL